MTTRAHGLNKIVARAQRDPAYRRALLADPRGAVEDELEWTSPDGVRITVIEETPREIYLVLPANLESSDHLDDDELSSVAGGTGQASNKTHCLFVSTCTGIVC